MGYTWKQWLENRRKHLWERDDDVLTFSDRWAAIELALIELFYADRLPGWVDEMLSRLHPREAIVLRMRYGLGIKQGETLQAIGESFNVSRERIRQIQRKGIRRIAHPTIWEDFKKEVIRAVEEGQRRVQDR